MGELEISLPTSHIELKSTKNLFKQDEYNKTIGFMKKREFSKEFEEIKSRSEKVRTKSKYEIK
ncbi:MAG: hypothetical protein CSB15_00290 [Clostridiales bacterium]|nr:MAG: hypothetical protein CSB15_00290 [Clostridiales bacterium]